MDASTPSALRRKLPAVEPSKRVAQIVDEHAGAAPPTLLGATAKGASIAPSAGPRGDVRAWMAPGGRLRIGPDGVPIKFTLRTTSKGPRAGAAGAGHAATAPGGAASLADPSHRGNASSSVGYKHAHGDDAYEYGGGDEGFVPDAYNLASKVAADKTHDNELSHHLRLIVALVGPVAAVDLSLSCVRRGAAAARAP